MIIRQIVTSVFLLFSSVIFGHEHLSLSKNEITEWYEDQYDSTIQIIETEECLSIEFNGHDKFNAKYYFDEYQLCDSIIIQYLCQDCAEKHLKNLLCGKKSKWVELESNSYMSRTKLMWIWTSGEEVIIWSPVVSISKTPLENICLTTTFSIIVKKRKEWKKLTKTKTTIC